MPRKLEAGLAGRYLMSRVLMTSTMKSEPGTPPMRAPDNSFGVPVSAAATCIVGGSAEGSRGAAAVVSVVAARAAVVALAAPATATPARNFRRLTSGRGCFRLIKFLPSLRGGSWPARLNGVYGLNLPPRQRGEKSFSPVAWNRPYTRRLSHAAKACAASHPGHHGPAACAARRRRRAGRAVLCAPDRHDHHRLHRRRQLRSLPALGRAPPRQACSRGTHAHRAQTA